jgi:hypothetical protein
MKVFFQPSVESVKYKDTDNFNQPVNLWLVETFFKSKFAHYPDNDGKPSICLIFHDVRVEWVYNTEEERDHDYARLLNVSRD